MEPPYHEAGCNVTPPYILNLINVLPISWEWYFIKGPNEESSYEKTLFKFRSVRTRKRATSLKILYELEKRETFGSS